MSGLAQCAEGCATAATTASAGVGLPLALCTAVPLLKVHTGFAPMLAAAVINNKQSTVGVHNYKHQGCLTETDWHPKLIGCLTWHLSLSVVVS
jgi:hypothetical protein